MIHQIAMLAPVVTASSLVGVIKFGSNGIHRMRDLVELMEQRALAQQAACYDRLKAMHKKEDERLAHHRLILSEVIERHELEVASEFNCPCELLFGTSLKRARDYWFANDNQWLYPARNAALEAYTCRCEQK